MPTAGNDSEHDRFLRLSETTSRLVLTIAGDAESVEITELHRYIDRATRDPKARPLDVDLSEADVMDVRVLGLLLYAASVMDIQGRAFVVRSPSPAAKQSLQMLPVVGRLLNVVE